MSSRLSIPRRVFLGFALVLTVSGIMSMVSIASHRHTATTLGLLREGYLPLSLLISEGRATQAVLGNLLDRTLSERNSEATQAWLTAARRGRPRLLGQALARVAELEALAPPAPERETLSRIRRDLRRIQTSLKRIEPLYVQLYQGLRQDTRPRSEVEGVVSDLRARERAIDGRLRSVWNALLARIEATSAAAAEQQEQFISILLVLGLIGLCVGVLVTVWSQRMLAPLPLLQRRVEAVARGDLARKLVPRGDDEIVRLAQEFERMVAALSARDSRLREAAQNQQQLQQMQAQILADLSAAVLVVDESGTLLTRNPAAEALFDLREQSLATPLRDGPLGERMPGLLAAVDRVAAEGKPISLTEERLSGPRERLLNLFVTPFGSQRQDGRRQVLIVAEDVTESVHTKARLIQTERLAAIGRMAAHVTHEVRNPLSSIGLNMELLEEELQSAGPEARELVVAIQREIDRLRALTEEYLRVARLPTPELREESIADLVRSTLEFLNRELRAAGIELRTEIPAGLPDVALDESQFRQVFLNLVRNARDAMPEGGSLTVTLERAREGVALEITDTGLGMEDEERVKIFDLFYTTKKLGTGLGLPLTQQIVLAHGGRIDCTSLPGRGTTFALWFPVAPDARSTTLAAGGEPGPRSRKGVATPDAGAARTESGSRSGEVTGVREEETARVGGAIASMGERLQ